MLKFSNKTANDIHVLCDSRRYVVPANSTYTITDQNQELVQAFRDVFGEEGKQVDNPDQPEESTDGTDAASDAIQEEEKTTKRK